MSINMNWYHRCLISLISLGTVFTTSTATLSQNLENVQIKTIPVEEGIYMLQGQGGNIGVLVGEDGVFLIDDQYAGLSNKIIDAVRKISKQPIRFLINTHWHPDHTGGNENLGSAGVVIIAHENVRDRLSKEQFLSVLDQKIPPSPPQALPIVTFSNNITLHLNKNEVRAFHVPPAHTDGDTVIYFRDANVLHTGDVYFNGSYPFVDRDSGGSLAGIIAAVDQLLSWTDKQTKIIPGHGKLSNRAELLTYRNLLVTVRDRVTKAIAKGISVEDFIASKPTADFDSTWGNGFLSPEQFLRIVYTDLSQADK